MDELQKAAPVYEPPEVIELGSVQEITLGKYAEDSQDQGRYFE
ncbi:lasso RiPP family leader peptide-containing protein [Streptomyces monticola]|uniref:Lasso RiPP family leader peptide-containing protein n=1 Tax=Streptomyces monticola TaxID=2666263 RepID=A0ABW2JS08_9ACTN